LDTPTAGEVSFGGTSIKNMSDSALSAFRRKKLGFIFQSFNLVPSLTALENVALPLLLDGARLNSVAEKATQLLNQVGLGAKTNSYPSQLSGGEMQRVAIARSLIADPEVILADEPTGNLDSKNGQIVIDLLTKLSKERGKTVIMVTHDPRAAEWGTRVIRMRDGVIESDTQNK
jgi:putative ABC transport system ATP-binding protein